MSNIVVVVDMLNGFLKEGKLAQSWCKMGYSKHIRSSPRKEKDGWRMIFVCDNHKKDDLEFSDVSGALCRRNRRDSYS